MNRQPSRPEMLNLLQDRTFMWLREQLKRQYPPLRPGSLPSSWEDAHLKAGQQQVMQAMRDLLGEEG